MAAEGAPAPATVRELIERQAAERPQSLYAIAGDGSRSLGYGALRDACRATVRMLDALGVGPGAHVSLVMPNGLGSLVMLLGSLYGGRCVNPVNLLAQPAQMHYVIEHADARVVLVSPDWEDRVRAIVKTLSRTVEVVVVNSDDSDDSDDPEGIGPPEPATNAARAAAAHADPHSRAEDPALLMYTSGTTGKPKGVMLTQANLVASACAISAEHRLTAADRVLAVLPLYHINAFAVTMLAPLAHGGSLLMPPRFSASAFWDLAKAHQCTWINLVPTMISYLIEAGTPPPGSLPALRFCRSASAALPPEHHRAFERKFGIGIIETMGLTETVAPSFSNPFEPDQRRLGSVGRPSGCEARIADSAGKTAAIGATGEILVRGPQVMKGYYKDPTATQAAFHADGWLRTGDLGHCDSDGFFFVTGRIKELIIKGGENIAPREVDEALLAHPAVLDAAAVGMPDRHYGQDVLACVVLREGIRCSEAELRRHCVEALGAFKAPRTILFVADLPRGPSGKVQRLKLLELTQLTDPP